MTNSLGSYVQEQMGLLGWSREALAELSGVDRNDLDTILEASVLEQWPAPEVVQSLASAFNVAVRDVVLHAARACGLNVDTRAETTESVQQVGSEVLMREVRRRLALGAAAGGYLATRSEPRLSV